VVENSDDIDKPILLDTISNVVIIVSCSTNIVDNDSFNRILESHITYLLSIN